ncbi:hypothetical protein ACOI1H_26255, partial [Loktanella sp. DJP18]|uniref:hypothetical protein n=1 Tax=Loktanella sp. DJP18 TaxID=3409788 RepID=UPI003BB6ECA8
ISGRMTPEYAGIYPGDYQTHFKRGKAATPGIYPEIANLDVEACYFSQFGQKLIGKDGEPNADSNCERREVRFRKAD